MLLRFILLVSKFRLHPGVHSLYTPMYTVCTPGCIMAVHPGLQKDLQRANFISTFASFKTQVLPTCRRSIFYIKPK